MNMARFHSVTGFVCALLIVTSTGCATVVKGTNQKIPVSSLPPNANVFVDGNLVGNTPLDVQMKRKRNHLVTFEKTGYESRSIPVVKDVGGAVWGNILLGGLIGWGVDATSGAQYNLSPTTINVKLESASDSQSADNSDNENGDFVRKLNDLDDLAEKEKISPEEYLKLRTALFKQYYPELLPSEPEKSVQDG